MHAYHFINDYRIGGQHIYVDTITKAIFDVDSSVITVGNCEMSDMALINLRRYWKPLYIVEILINSCTIIMWAFKKKILVKNAVFHVHGGVNLSPLISGRLLKIPILWHIHETASEYKKFIDVGKNIIKKSNHVIAIVATQSILAYDLADTIYLPASIDSKFWTRSIAKGELDDIFWGLNGEEKNNVLKILAVGNINPLKGFDILLEALEILTTPCELKIVGPELETHNDYALLLYQKAAKLELEHKNIKINFLGWQNREKIRALLSTCDLYILPSRSEACPIALLQALAMGCSCIATDVGDVRRMLQNSDSSDLIPPNDVSALKNSLINFKLLQGRRLNDLSSVGIDWDLEKVAIDTQSTYRMLIG